MNAQGGFMLSPVLHRLRALALVAALVLASACSEGLPAAGAPPDAGLDAGLADGGIAGDGGSAIDGGPTQDGGLASDGGSKLDGGFEPDAGLPPDGGAPVPTWDPASAPLREERFPLGVQSGDVTPGTAILWTHYTGSEPLVARLVEDAAAPPYRIAGDFPATPVDGYTKVRAGTLRPGTRYRLYFLENIAGGARSSVGLFRSAPSPDTVNRAHFGATSCTKQSYAPFPSLVRGAYEDLDFFLLLGDTTYNDTANSRTEYRSLWSENLATEGYRKLLASTSHMATWDDHEVVNDFDGETVDPARLSTAREAFFENLAIERQPAPTENRIWRKFHWGRAVEVFVLDCRGERRPSTRNTASAEYISPAQMAWLKQGLLDSTAAWRIIANSVPVGNFPLAFDAAQKDRWEGYPAQRQELFDFIVQHQMKNVVFVSGDFHVAAVARLEPSGPMFQYYEILAGPGGQFPNPLYLTLTGAQFELSSPTNNVVVFDADATVSPPTLRFRFLDGNGGVFFDKTITPAP